MTTDLSSLNDQNINETAEDDTNESYYLASSWQLMRRKFFKHKLALFGGLVLLILYIVGPLFAGFFSPADVMHRHRGYVLAPPQVPQIFHEGRLKRPFVYGYDLSRDMETLRRIYTKNKTKVHPINFFVRGHEYKLLGLFPTDVHFIGVKDGTMFLFGTDELGRDMLSRTIRGARVSLMIGLLGVTISFILGCALGGISGYFGGAADMLIQRIIEFLISIPSIPLWMVLASAVPVIWPPVRTYFMITIILSIIGWTGLARIVRGKLLQLREEDFVMAATVYGASDGRIITRHLLPGFLSYLIVHLTLSVPSMILAETALSFIGVGLRAPVISWGVQLQQAQNVRTIALQPWLLIPALFVVITVLCFNFLGDGLRDAADPYKQ
ncbi:MAG: peptide ABC transporter permease [Trueperaceae bacterium]|jgi:peptide/nickel transport system permease protein|nr:peptide ABC transporter permease [Trueperaceae bacterium]|tara:strand:+ start:3596 stop:4741 length:1146 start_codon:yes stop_codon:yes gene_type:complete